MIFPMIVDGYVNFHLCSFVYKTHFTYPCIVTYEPDSKPDQKYSRRGQANLHSEEKGINLRFEQQVFHFVYKIMVRWECADFEVVVVKFMTVFLEQGTCLPLAMGCDRITALTPCQQKHLPKLSAYVNITAVMLDQEYGREANPNWVRRHFFADTRASNQKRNTGTITKRCILLMKFLAVLETNIFNFKYCTYKN